MRRPIHFDRVLARNSITCAVLLLLMMGANSPLQMTYAQDDPTPTRRAVTQSEVNAAAQNLYCPVCENLPLAVCFTDACEDWKQQVHDLLAQGYTVAEIEAYFVARFGQKTVGTPTTPQALFLTVVLPAALIALIGIVAVVNLVQWRRKTEHIPASETESLEGTFSGDKLDGEYRARLEAELKQDK